jgi:spore maturation protein CgeB
MNPRAYEIALCQALQLYIDARQEAHDIFGDNIIYSDSENITKALTYIFKEMIKEEESKKIYECFERVKNGHLYLFRAQKIVDCLNQGEDNE